MKGGEGCRAPPVFLQSHLEALLRPRHTPLKAFKGSQLLTEPSAGHSGSALPSARPGHFFLNLKNFSFPPFKYLSALAEVFPGLGARNRRSGTGLEF